MIDQQKEYAVGLSINANHVGSARNGTVYGKGIIVHKGKSTHVWSIEIKDDLNKLISVSRLTVMIINKDK